MFSTTVQPQDLYRLHQDDAARRLVLDARLAVVRAERRVRRADRVTRLRLALAAAVAPCGYVVRHA